MAKFKVGDKVRILDGSKIKNYTGNWCAKEMKEFVGEVHTVISVFPQTHGRVSYYLEGLIFKWDERGLELVEASKKRKFKDGDKVIGNDKAGSIYNITKKGWIGEVVKDFGDGDILVKSENEPQRNFIVDDLFFDLLERKSEQKIVITTDGKRTTAVLYDGKKRVKEVSAVCSDDDTFDFMTGAKIAFERLTEEKEPERDLRELLKDGVFGKERKSGNFVIVNGLLIYERGGYDRVSILDRNLESDSGFTHIDELYSGVMSFDRIERSTASLLWKRKEIK